MKRFLLGLLMLAAPAIQAQDSVIVIDPDAVPDTADRGAVTDRPLVFGYVGTVSPKVPLTEFVRTDTYRAERWTVPWGERVLYFFELDDETVWGATAVMLVDLLTRVAAIAA